MKECCRFKTGNCVAECNPQAEENFARDRKRKDGLTPHCKACLKVYRDTHKEQRNETIKKWRLNHPEIMKGYHFKDRKKSIERTKRWRENNPDNLLLGRYGITRNDFNKMREEQNNSCAICKVHQSQLPRSLNVDHCHATNKVRGLLCDKCNKALGLFEDNIDRLKIAILYVERVK